MKIRIELLCENEEQAAAALEKLQVKAKMTVEDSIVVPADKAEKKTTKKKEAAPAKVEEETVEAADEDLGFDVGEAEEEPKEKTVSQAEVIKAFQVFAQKKGVEEAKKIMGKFGVSNVRQIEPQEFARVMKALKV